MKINYVFLCAILCGSWGLKSCAPNEKKPVQENQNKAPYELRTVLPGKYDTLTLADGVRAELLDSVTFPYDILPYEAGLIISKYPHRLMGEAEENAADMVLSPHQYKTQLDVLNNFKGFQTSLCADPNGGFFIAAMPNEKGNRFAKGYIYHVNQNVVTKLTALGSSSFVGLLAIKDKSGKTVLYYTDQSKHIYGLYRFVPKNTGNYQEGNVFTADIYDGKWVELNLDNPILAKKYSNPSQLLLNINEATGLLGINKNEAISSLQYRPNDGTILFNMMPRDQVNLLYGGINSFFEQGGDIEGTTMHKNPIIVGGLNNLYTYGISLARSQNGHLWAAGAIPYDKITKPAYETFACNALYVLPQKGPQTSLVLRIAAAPAGFRFNGLHIDEANKTLYTTMQNQMGSGVLLKLSGPSLIKMLE